MFQGRGLTTSNDLSPRRVLDHGMTHVVVPDERRWRLASGSDLHEFEIRMVCSRVANRPNMSVCVEPVELGENFTFSTIRPQTPQVTAILDGAFLPKSCRQTVRHRTDIKGVCSNQSFRICHQSQ